MINSVNAIRVLSVDMIQRANSGHPGICMGASPMLYSLYNKVMNVSNEDDKWFNRDRFILSAGHGSAMLYSTLHLMGYDITIEDLKNFRQLNSKTPGHPEITHTKGIDATSGPLGQGIAQAVGFAIAEKHLSSKYNKEGYSVVDNYTYVICGDGDLQEGISAEASSLAGHLGLNKLIVLWDANEVQLDAVTNVATSEDIMKRYESYGWNTLEVEDGENVEDITSKVLAAKTSNKPTFIKVNTIIGFGSPNKAGTPDAHGAPLGSDEIKLMKSNYGWELEEFVVSDEIYQDFSKAIVHGNESKNAWIKLVKEYVEKYPQLGQEFMNIIKDDVDYDINIEFNEQLDEASRVSSGKMIQAINSQIPNLIGGSADLSKSNNSIINDSGIFGIDSYSDKNISFGVREFAMGAIINGITLYGGLKAYCATFFVFSDYLKAAMRMSAIQEIPSIYVYTHDSVAVGEDGPTHEPIEQLSGLRAIPNFNVVRPCDANEVKAAWKIALNSKSTPTALVLTRQNMETITTGDVYENVSMGAYIISDMENYDKVLIGSGSEVKLLLDVQKELLNKSIKTRVVSMPCIELFLNQPEEYQNFVLGDLCMKHRFYVEMASAAEGYQFAKNVISINRFGLSGPANDVISELGFTVDAIVKKIIS